VIVVEDIDFRGHFAEPPCPALDRYVALYSASVTKRGADPNIGPRLPALLRAAGFSDVETRGVAERVEREIGNRQPRRRPLLRDLLCAPYRQ
jgi:hypothetical protein